MRMPDIMKRLWLLLITMMLLVSCGGIEDSEQSSKPLPSSDVKSILQDESAAQLIHDMEEGIIPAECRVMYDAMGSRPEVVITDPEIITEVYNRLGEMLIGGETNESITDCYHYVIFVLQDGSKVGWNFEGEGILCRGQTNYEVVDPGTLWNMVQSMQEEIMEGEEK